ncbi:MAG: membrane protein insertion efficiency factor YidD [Candidatus Komeilibacteria bacterium CG10_big_fil_rev_8_21_14_0_10_41_13]|uniref:Putative membrane protein insertion efficiency factor n=1 Tax=Candidatus Komeilibacteria bacterium CG10_big_fil_rev_8_21_14_0_10_41_13 TaxID=1974476 RepID=A0A2M6WCX1_9BACT|nr:MAG: membrane protein insertion efficiency factor YidD [Candidatus Komeilibacteria bacterium CG10_big_fil_rev_8_21_14_0_10_41_13]
MFKLLVLKFIRLYQKTLSPDQGLLSYKYPYGYCRFYPHCSEYAYQAVEKYGLIKGSLLSLKRLIKCNPFNRGGADPLK